jgi:cobalt-zinc-cadmium efflux system membrane fusion protein
MNKRNFILLGFGLAAGLLIGAVGFPLIYQSEAGGSQMSSLPESGGATSAQAVTEIDSATDWCMEHRVPESGCTKCHPNLIPAFKAAGDWCVEHDLPESQCRRCHPDLTFPQEPKSAASAGIDALTDESFKPSVFFPKNEARCATDDAIIQFASAETAERAGLTLAPAMEVKQSVSAEAPAEVLFDETKSYAITTNVPVLVVRWMAEPGDVVSAGQALAELESPEMPHLKADYLETSTEAQLREQDFGRADSLNRKGLISTAEYQQIAGAFATTQARLSGARGLLQACGLTDDDLQLIKSGQLITPRWLLRATTSSAFLERKAALGELLPAGSRLGLIGDPASLWIEAHVRESDLSLFRKGQTVEFATDGDALEKVSGRVIWVAQYVDPLTRSATVRAKIANATLDLKAHQFGRLVLPTSLQESTVAVPRDAVQWEGCCNVVFVKEAPDRYRPHKVTVSRGDRGYYNISSGLRAGDMVVVKGSYLLKTELKKGSLGAGCCGVAPEA